MRMIHLLPALALIASGVPALASQQQTAPSTTTEENGGTPAAPAKPAKPAKPRKICREEDDGNSRMPRRTCHTQEEWDAIDGRSRGNRDIPNRATQ